MKGYVKGQFNLICFLLGHDENENIDWGYCQRCKRKYSIDGWCKPLWYIWADFIISIKRKFKKENSNDLPF